MKLIKDLGRRTITSRTGKTRTVKYGLFLCPHCGDSVEKELSKGGSIKCCNKTECRRIQNHLSQPNKLKPSKYCKIIKELGVVEYTNSKGNLRRESKAIFECCECGEPFTALRADGIRMKSGPCCTKKVRARTNSSKEYKEARSKSSTKHGMAGTKFYNVWRGMQDRCNNPNNNGYKRYGAKGIKVCDEWANSFEQFKADMYDGYLQLTKDIADGKYLPDDRPSIDRIDPKGDYCKDNCQWLTLRENSIKDHRRPVEQLDKVTGEVIASYNSVTEAMDALRALGHKAYDFQITYVCTGKANSHMGYKWRYK